MKDDDIESLIKYRIEEARTALDDAGFLIKNKRSAQSIVNRLYYAMFYAALALLQKSGNIPSRHSGVISLFDTEFVLKGILPRELSKSFHQAFELRHTSDYRVMKPVAQSRIDELHKQTANFVKEVAEYLGHPAKT